MSYNPTRSTVVFGDFEWNEAKAASNLEKHGISFEEAATVFDDIHVIIREDHSNHESFIAIGTSRRERILFVVHAERGERIRIISARKASAAQKRTYARG